MFFYQIMLPVNSMCWWKPVPEILVDVTNVHCIYCVLATGFKQNQAGIRGFVQEIFMNKYSENQIFKFGL